MNNPLPFGSTIGILGGGQLGRMLSVAAARLGYKTHIFEPAANPPAAHVADRVTTAAYEDLEALHAFAASVDIVTYEFENVPTSALDAIEEHVLLRPNREALRISQDRLTEKSFLQDLGLKTAPFANVESQEDLEQAVAQLGMPSILKTRRFGYDGKGQLRLSDAADLAGAFDAVGRAPSVLEGFVEFTCEISIIVARNVEGEVACFDPAQNVHEGGILRTSTVPATVPQRLIMDGVLLAGQIVRALEYVGVMGVELFVTPSELIVNEIAPRVHNSGHWTQNGCGVDQFEQHIRAVTGHSLGDGRRYANVVMENIIGSDMHKLPEYIKEPNACVHLYGKDDMREGRKMGHVNLISALSK